MKMETSRLIIENLTRDDAAFTLALLNDQDFIANIGDRQIRTVAEAEMYLLNGPIASYRDNGFGMYAVREKSTGATLGMCGLVKRAALENVDIGYGFLPAGRGQGYAFEAASRVVELALKELDIRRLVAIVSPENKASIALLEALGLIYDSKIQLALDEDPICLYVLQAHRHGSPYPA